MANYTRDQFIQRYNATTNGFKAGYNGIQSGFVTYECYMVLKYGDTNTFGKKYTDNDREYLLELPVYPDEVQESIEASWSVQNPLGRSVPIAGYSNTSFKTVNFSLDFHRDLLTGSYSLTADQAASINLNGYKGGGDKVTDKSQLPGYQQELPGGPFDTRSWYIAVNKMFQAACYPQYTQNGQIPPTVYFVFGQMILKGFITNYSTSWKKPLINQFYSNNTVNITMYCYADNIISARDILGKDGSASTQNTFNTRFPTKATANNDIMNNITQRSNNRTSGSLGGGARDT